MDFGSLDPALEVTRMLRIARRLVPLTAAVLVVAACSAPAEEEPGGSNGGQDGELDTVSVALTALNSMQIWAVVARDHDLMEDWGIDLDIVLLDGTARIVPALLADEVQLAAVTVEQAMAANLQEPDLQMLVTFLSSSPYSLVAGEHVQEVEDLQGGTIGVNGIGSSADYFGAKLFLADLGLEEGPDYTFIQAGNAPQRVAALESGQVDAILSWEPDTSRAIESGGHVVASLMDSPSLAGVPVSVFAGLRTWYEEEPDIATRWVRAYQDAVRWMQDPENRDLVVQSIADQQQVDAELAERTYEQFFVNMPPEDPIGTVTREGLARTLENGHAAGVESLRDITPDDLEQFYDNSLTEAAQELDD